MEAVLNGWLLMFGLCQALSIWKGRGGRAGGIDGWRGGGRERGREGGRERLHTNTHVLFLSFLFSSYL